MKVLIPSPLLSYTAQREVEASGASSVSVFATGELRTDASGASKIVYGGTPTNVEKSSSGASTIREK